MEAKTIVLVSPAVAESNNGNWHTAHRWAQFLSGYCDIAMQVEWLEPAETALISSGKPRALQAMIALHARRSAASIKSWATAFPNKPLIVVLTGTDLYRDIHSDAQAQESLALATHLVVLQEAGLAALPERWRSKAQVIYQSARALKPAVKSPKNFRALMVGHLREEKDPMTFMRAAGHDFDDVPLPINFDHIGQALDALLGEAVKVTEQRHARYRWLGGLPRAATRQHIKRADVLVNCSNMEGGAHVVLEAVQSGTPVLASRISGNVGMLGADYAGYFTLGHDAELAALVKRCATEPAFLARLKNQCQQRARLFQPEEEKRLVLNLVTTAINRT